VVRRDYFSPEEKELYMSLFTGARRQFSTYVGAGTVLNSKYWFHVTLVTRLTDRLLQYLLAHHPKYARSDSMVMNDS
jgi:hypothetical protein